MKDVKRKIGVVLSVTTLITLSGCQTAGGVQEQLAGAGIGAAVGCGVGALITGSGRGCAGGAAIGGALGWTVVAIDQYQAQQVRSSGRDRRVYGLAKPVTSPQVKINQGSNSPRTVRAGQSVDITTDYSVRLPADRDNVTVTEQWTLKQNGKTVAQLPKKTAERDDGGWKAEAEITVPSNTKPGTYLIEHKVQAGSSYDTKTSTFKIMA